MKHARTILWMAILTAPLVWIGTGNADPAVGPAPTSTTTSTSTSTSSTSSTSTSTTSTSTTTTVPAGDWRCPEWVPYLVFVGFPTSELQTADRILWAESKCDATAVNPNDPGGSYGGFQINAVWLNWFLPDRGIAWSATDLYDPVINAAAAYAIWQRSGWHPWSTY